MTTQSHANTHDNDLGLRKNNLRDDNYDEDVQFIENVKSVIETIKITVTEEEAKPIKEKRKVAVDWKKLSEEQRRKTKRKTKVKQEKLDEELVKAHKPPLKSLR